MDKGKREKVNVHRMLNGYAKKGCTVMAGSSLCEQFPISELGQSLGLGKLVYNRGVGGFTTDEMLESLEDGVLALEPQKLLTIVGGNDVLQPGYTPEKVADNFAELVRRCRARVPGMQVTVVAVFPVNSRDDFGMPAAEHEALYRQRSNEVVTRLNAVLRPRVEALGCTFLDLNALLVDEEGQLRSEYTIEGLHLWPNAYRRLYDGIKEYL